VVKARATSTPGHFEFRLEGLALITAGGAVLTFDAFAVTSRLEVWGHAGPGRAEAAWVAADALDFEDAEAAVRHVRWRAFDRDITGGQLQVSTVPFPPSRGGP
jgi:hypothetical protein